MWEQATVLIVPSELLRQVKHLTPAHVRVVVDRVPVHLDQSREVTGITGGNAIVRGRAIAGDYR